MVIRRRTGVIAGINLPISVATRYTPFWNASVMRCSQLGHFCQFGPKISCHSNAPINPENLAVKIGTVGVYYEIIVLQRDSHLKMKFKKWAAGQVGLKVVQQIHTTSPTNVVLA